MNRTIEKVRSELRKHNEKYAAAKARSDEWACGFHAGHIACLEDELFRLEKAEREQAEASESQYRAFMDEQAAWDFGASLEAGMPGHRKMMPVR